jgi:hypothetical protein
LKNFKAEWNGLSLCGVPRYKNTGNDSSWFFFGAGVFFGAGGLLELRLKEDLNTGVRIVD